MQGLILVYKKLKKKTTYLNELNDRKPLVVSISKRGEELKFYNVD
jgi:hypothetical protein